MTKIKICGLKRMEDIDCVNELKPDYAGFVFFPPSSRYVTIKQAKLLSSRLSSDIIPVGVFLNNSLEEIMEIANSGAVKVLQIHGENAAEIVRRLKSCTELPVWEAIQIRSEEDIIKAKNSLADLIVLDNGLGGTGETFDWNLLNEVGRDYILAGGLNQSNIGEALACKPFGVDVSSGVETDKKKDPVKMRKFVELVRAKERNIG